MKKNIALSIAAIALTLVAINSFTPVFAYRGDVTKRGPNCTDEQHAEVLSLLKNKDYSGWVKEMTGKGVIRKVNETNFKEFADARIAAENGDVTKLNEFRTKYGMGQGMRGGMGQGKRMMNQN